MEPSKKQPKPNQERHQEWSRAMSSGLTSKTRRNSDKHRYGAIETKGAQSQSQKERLEKCLQALQSSAGISCLLVYSHAVAGKERLLRSTEILQLKGTQAVSSVNSAQIPFGAIDIVSADSGIFNWRDYYTHTLAALNDLNVDNISIAKERG